MNKKTKGWSISEELFEWMIANIDIDSSILEFGSGNGTTRLCKHFNVTSIEHNEEWLNKAIDSEYIYAPIVEGWYDVNCLDKIIGKKYSAVLIDGPPGNIGRDGVIMFAIDNPELFDGIIIIDDTNRIPDMKLVDKFIEIGYRLVTTIKSDIHTTETTIMKRDI